MYLNEFSVRVPEGNEKSSGYVEIEHNTQYTIQLRNYRYVRCDATVSVDGKIVGVFRLNANGSLRLERPSHDKGRFTFYKAGTKEASKAGISSIPYNDRGLISVTFVPEKEINWTGNYKVQTYTADTNNYPCVNYVDDGYVDDGSDYNFSYTANYANYCAPEFPEVQEQSFRMPEAEEVNYRKTSVEASNALDRSNDNLRSGITGLSGKSKQKFVDVGRILHDESQTTTINLRLVAIESEHLGPRPLTSFFNPVPPVIH